MLHKIFGFDYMLTPKILVVLYCLSLILVVICGIVIISSESIWQGILAIIGGWIGVRIFFEMIMIAFKNNEYLKKISEK